jgi:hypothetical protein
MIGMRKDKKPEVKDVAELAQAALAAFSEYKEADGWVANRLEKLKLATDEFDEAESAYRKAEKELLDAIKEQA